MNGQTPRKLSPSEGFYAGEVALASGATLGRYELVSMVATGGMAQVWAAERRDAFGLSRLVALKVIRPEFADDVEYARMFVDEATIASAVRHPNVCETYELARQGSTLFMAMELIPGDSLGGVLRVGGRVQPLEPTMAAKICADAALGLHAAHELKDAKGVSLGVVHRDVSPSNILISLHGQVKVTDFGIAKARHQLHERTRTGEIKGKFGYLAPEQVRARATVDRRADVYALGCVLYTSVLGMRPFGNGLEAIPNILEGRFKKPRELRPELPRELEEIILVALASRPEDRFETAEEFREQLETWLWREGTSISQTDVAELLRRRLPEEAYRTAQSHLMGGRASPEDVYRRLLESSSEIEFDTAVSTPRTSRIDLGISARDAVPPSSPTVITPTVIVPPIATPSAAPRVAEGARAKAAETESGALSSTFRSLVPEAPDSLDLDEPGAFWTPSRPPTTVVEESSPLPEAPRLPSEVRRPRTPLVLVAVAAAVATSVAVWFVG